jgi:hypothetical protein
MTRNVQEMHQNILRYKRRRGLEMCKIKQQGEGGYVTRLAASYGCSLSLIQRTLSREETLRSGKR